jgi:hypothetical protein
MRGNLGTLCFLLCGAVGAHAKDVTKTAASGKQTLMWSYAHWKNDCSPDLGVVKVLAKPEHGTLAPREDQGTIRHPGLRRPGPIACIGKPTPTFKVYYTSERGFRGADHFKIEVSYRGDRPDVDTFTVDVR